MSENTDSKKLFLLDGFALIFRAHFAFISRPMINSKGVNTSAVYGFVNTLWELIKKERSPRYTTQWKELLEINSK